jgi:hypothetical protein
VVIYVSSNAFVLILSWFPANLQSTTHTTQATLPYYTGPVTALGIISFGIFWWTWDTHICPFLGYIFETREEWYTNENDLEVLRVHFHVSFGWTANNRRNIFTLKSLTNLLLCSAISWTPRDVLRRKLQNSWRHQLCGYGG